MKTEHIITLYEKYLLQLQAKSKNYKLLKQTSKLFSTHIVHYYEKQKNEKHTSTLLRLLKRLLLHTPARNTKKKRKKETLQEERFPLP